MIARLAESLQEIADAAARPHEEQSMLREVAADFSDAFLLVCDCPQLHLTAAQLEKLRAVEVLLESVTNAEPVAAPDEWESVREAARAALESLEQTYFGA